METSRKKTFANDRHETAGQAPGQMTDPAMSQVAGNSERRRIGRIVHDDRGNATLDWRDAPADYHRPVLDIESEARSRPIQKVPRAFNPYGRVIPHEASSKAPPPRKDLRKLSEWIKMMRDLEERKRRGEVE
jgi:hypothetical protein